MLIRTLEIVCGILSVTCSAIIMVCFLFDVKRKCIPTIVALGGGVLYTIFLTISGLVTHWEYLPMLFAFAVSALITAGNYRDEKQKKAVTKERFEEFKRECFEARTGVQVI